MKIFIDTNIFLDLILQREYYKESILILNAIDKNMFDGVVLDITLLNIDYIAKKQVKDVREFIGVINKSFSVFGADNNSFTKALQIDNNDLEDNLQYICAKKEKCELIISNDKSFYSDDMKIFTSYEFVKKYIK